MLSTVHYSEYFDFAFTALKTQAASGGARAMQISWAGKQQIPALLTDTGLVQALAWKTARERGVENPDAAQKRSSKTKQTGNWHFPKDGKRKDPLMPSPVTYDVLHWMLCGVSLLVV